MTDWIEKEISIEKIKSLLDDGYDVEISSPDGWVTVGEYIDKGDWEEYILTTENGLSVRCNENHLFKTVNGWMSTNQIMLFQNAINYRMAVYTDSGLSKCYVEKTGKKIPIVDIQVNHTNQRYYTNGVESHNTAVGKSLFMCHMAANNMMDGKNVLYITLELSEERVAERVDSNLLDVPIEKLQLLSKDEYIRKVDRLKEKCKGKLIIKEYPTSSASAANFRYLLNELRIKKNFIPDIIYIDYLNLCLSARIKSGANVNSYTYVKAIAEELRGIAVEFNLPIVSATQTTRSGFSNSDPGLEDTSESFGLPATADFMVALISSESLEQLNQVLVKQLKNRYGDPAKMRKFVVGIDKSKMRLYNLDKSAQDGIIDIDIPSSIAKKPDIEEKKKKFQDFT